MDDVFCPLPDLKDEEFFNLEFQEGNKSGFSSQNPINLIFGNSRLKTLQSSISRRF